MNILFFIVFALSGWAQNKNVHLQSGNFVCKIKNYIIFTGSTNNDEEYPSFSLKALNFRTKEKILIDSNLLSPCCVRLSDTIIVFSNRKSLVYWNSINKNTGRYLKSESGYEIIGVGIDQNRNNLLLFQFNYKNYEMLIKIINTKTKTTTFQQKIRVNETEIEGIYPAISTKGNFFIFSIQDKLYSINLTKPELKIISDNCDAFAIYNAGVVYYKFTTNERTEGYYVQLIKHQTNKVDSLLNDKIYNCVKSFMLTSTQNKKYFPYYILCGTPYIYSDDHWLIANKVVIFRDHQIQIELPMTNKKVDGSNFLYKLLE